MWPVVIEVFFTHMARHICQRDITGCTCIAGCTCFYYVEHGYTGKVSKMAPRTGLGVAICTAVHVVHGVIISTIFDNFLGTKTNPYPKSNSLKSNNSKCFFFDVTT